MIVIMIEVDIEKEVEAEVIKDIKNIKEEIHLIQIEIDFIILYQFITYYFILFILSIKIIYLN